MIEVNSVRKDVIDYTRIVINNESKRLVEGWANVEVVDRQGDIISAETLSKAMIDYMSRGGIVMFGHQNKPIGRVVQWSIEKSDDVVNAKALHIIAEIYRDTQVADEVWKLIKDGKLKGFSIGGVAKKTSERVDKSGNRVRVLEEIELEEISVVETPANQFALIEAVSVAKGDSKSLTEAFYEEAEAEKDGRPPKKWWDRCVRAVSGKTSSPERLCGYVFYHILEGDRERAKEMEKEDDTKFSVSIEELVEALKENYKIGDNRGKFGGGGFEMDKGVEIEKPFGKWKNFADCVSDMKRQGYDDDSAHRICGKLQAKLEKYNIVSEGVIDKIISIELQKDGARNLMSETEHGGDYVGGSEKQSDVKLVDIKLKEEKVNATGGKEYKFEIELSNGKVAEMVYVLDPGEELKVDELADKMHEFLLINADVGRDELKSKLEGVVSKCLNTNNIVSGNSGGNDMRKDDMVVEGKKPEEETVKEPGEDEDEEEIEGVEEKEEAKLEEVKEEVSDDRITALINVVSQVVEKLDRFLEIVEGLGEDIETEKANYKIQRREVSQPKPSEVGFATKPSDSESPAVAVANKGVVKKSVTPKSGVEVEKVGGNDISEAIRDILSGKKKAYEVRRW
jgi:HK97 family phage prohead protease